MKSPTENVSFSFMFTLYFFSLYWVVYMIIIIIIIMPTCTDNMGKGQNGKNPILNVSFFEGLQCFYWCNGREQETSNVDCSYASGGSLKMQGCLTLKFMASDMF